MAQKRTITINGRLYDAVTGLPVKTPASQKQPEAPKPKPKAKTESSASRGQATAEAVHSSLQRSTALARRAAKKPVAVAQKVIRRSQTGRAMDIARRPTAKKFSPNPVVTKPASTPDVPAQAHPVAERAISKAAAKKQARLKKTQPKTSKEVKEEAIAKALAAPKPQAPKKRSLKAKTAEAKRLRKRLLIIAGCIILALGALYAVYRFIPAVSVSIAASRAGVSASYPDFVPDGFALNQPVTYGEGEVKLKFSSNSNDSAYTITQKRSTWDSSAVLDNIVEPLVGENYTTTQERGLKIFTYTRGAAWVNGGVLYTLSGNAALSNDQIRRIATSL